MTYASQARDTLARACSNFFFARRYAFVRRRTYFLLLFLPFPEWTFDNIRRYVSTFFSARLNVLNTHAVLSE